MAQAGSPRVRVAPVLRPAARGRGRWCTCTAARTAASYEGRTENGALSGPRSGCRGYLEVLVEDPDLPVHLREAACMALRRPSRSLR